MNTRDCQGGTFPLGFENASIVAVQWPNGNVFIHRNLTRPNDIFELRFLLAGVLNQFEFIR